MRSPGITARIATATQTATFVACLLACAVLAPGQSTRPSTVQVVVHDEQAQPRSGVKLQSESDRGIVAMATTGTDGKARIACPRTRTCAVTATAPGYLPVRLIVSPKDQSDGTVMVIALHPMIQTQETVSVHGESTSPVTESAGNETDLPIKQATASPLRPATLADTLPLVPGVVRTMDGRVKIAGLDELHSTLLVNSVNVTDPATGGFGLSIPVDSVQDLKVAQSPYQAQYGNFTAGVVSAETKRGGDKWNYDLNDPLPEFRIRSARVEGLRATTPRLNVDGPILKNRLYLLEGTEYLLNRTEVRTLPFPVNETDSRAINSFTQLDQILGPGQTLTASLHFAPHSLKYANLNYFDPRPVTPNGDYQEDTGTILDRWGVGGGLLSSTLAVTQVTTSIRPQSDKEMVLSPTGNSGSYFSSQSREATRIQWLETWSPTNIQWHGEHSVTLGSVLAHAEDAGTVTAQTVALRNASGNVIRQITWSGPGRFSLADFEPAFYGQDHWMLYRNFALDLGLRAETQSLTYTTRFAPRGGFSWVPDESAHTIVRGGVGVFYDEVPLDVYAFGSYPHQVVTSYDDSGNIVDGPLTYLNVIGSSAASEFPFFIQKKVSGNFAPYSVAWNLQMERVLLPVWTLRVEYLQSNQADQLTLRPETGPAGSALLLSGSGAGELHQFSATSKLGTDANRQFFFSYVRQLSRGEQSDAAQYLGDFPMPVVRSPIDASNAGEIPNRFLLWGMTVLPWTMRIAPRVELRNGFPWQPVDATQNFVPLSSYLQPRFPRYFTADARVSKDLHVPGSKHAFRLSVTGTNLTNHANALQVHNNIADPQYGTYFGNYPRHFIVDCDLLF